jgi:trk system potassium uptake protein
MLPYYDASRDPSRACAAASTRRTLARAVKIFVLGAGLVGATVVEALQSDHNLTVVDIDAAKLKPLAQLYDVATVRASAASGRELAAAGIADAELVIACTSVDEANLVAGTIARKLAPKAMTIVRTSSSEYAEIWRESRLDIDLVVSSEFETARAVSQAIGMPYARQTDTFAEGKVAIVELDVGVRTSGDVLGRKLRDARLPADSRVAGIIRGGQAIVPSGDAVLAPGDRVVAIGSPPAAQEWCQLVSPSKGVVRDAAVFGAQMLGTAIARTLIDQGISVRIIEPDPDRAALVADRLPEAHVFNATGLDRGFMQREGIARVQSAIFAFRDDAQNLFAATLARVHGVAHTIALAHHPVSPAVYERGGIDVTVDPANVTAEEIVRFAHDPRTLQVSMLEDDRYEILDVTTRPESELVGLSLRQMPIRGALIGAIVRNGDAIFPRSDDVLRAGDRVIVFTESARAPVVERAL